MAVLISSLLVIFLVLGLSVSFVNRKKKKKNRHRQQVPPSPPGLPFLGHLHLLGRLPHRSLRSLAASHGPVMLLRLGRVPAVVVSSAAAAEEAMKTRDLAFSGRPRLLMAERLLYGCRDVGFAPYGEYWRQARRVCAVHLLSPRRVLSFRRVREQEVAALLDRIREQTAGAGTGVVNLSDALIYYSKKVISRAAFGDGDDYGIEDLRRVIADFEELIAAVPMQEMIAPWLGWAVDTLTGLEAKTARTFQALDGFLDRVIADHRSSRSRRDGGSSSDDDDDHRDFVDVLLDVNEMDKEAGLRLDTDDIKAIVLDIFAAGTDTASTVLGWAMAELINHPDEMRKLQDQIRRAAAGLGGGSGVITEDHLAGGDLPYLKAVVSKTMRLHAPAPFLIPRETVEDTELQGYLVPAGTRVMINAWAIGREPAAWKDSAEEFVPARWLLFSDDNESAAAVDYSKVGVGQDFRFLPFGAGRRGCPGAGFAAPTMELALANMLYHFDWEPATRGQSLDMSEEFGLSLRLKAPLLLVAKPWLPH